MNTPINSNENSVNQEAANEEIRAEQDRLEMLSREEAASAPAGGNDPSRAGGAGGNGQGNGKALPADAIIVMPD